MSRLKWVARIFNIESFRLDSARARNQLESYIDGLQAVGKKTDLYGSTHKAIDIAAGNDDSTMIIIFTDGQDNVNSTSVDQVLSKYLKARDDNPHLFVLCYYFSFSNDNRPLPFPSQIPTTRLNRDDADFLQNLNKALADVDNAVGERLKEINAKEEKLKQKENSLKDRQDQLLQREMLVEAELKSLQSKRESLTEEERIRQEKLQAELNSVSQRRTKLNFEKQALDIEREKIKNAQKTIVKELSKIADEWDRIAQERAKLQGIEALLTEAINDQ